MKGEGVERGDVEVKRDEVRGEERGGARGKRVGYEKERGR